VLIACVINVSEGRDDAVLAELAAAAAPALLDLHRDPDHHRSVFTLAGEPDAVTEAAHDLAAVSVTRLDLGSHQGVHPRLGVLDVVPFVPYHPGRLPNHADHQDVALVVPQRDAFARWLSTTFGIPSFLYGPLPGGRSRALPQIRRHAFGDLRPDFGPEQPHRTAGATAVGARGVLVAYNVWVSSVEVARAVAPLVRSPEVRSLGLAVGAGAQVSCNLIDPGRFGPEPLYDSVCRLVADIGGAVHGAELVGLLPTAVLHAIPPARWSELGLAESDTVEARLLEA
jgi:glutamate formiminotransferase / 5-formyltetrahydrofolate cyclo-ligase